MVITRPVGILLGPRFKILNRYFTKPDIATGSGPYVPCPNIILGHTDIYVPPPPPVVKISITSADVLFALLGSANGELMEAILVLVPVVVDVAVNMSVPRLTTQMTVDNAQA